MDLCILVTLTHKSDSGCDTPYEGRSIASDCLSIRSTIALCAGFSIHYDDSNTDENYHCSMLNGSDVGGGYLSNKECQIAVIDQHGT